METLEREVSGAAAADSSSESDACSAKPKKSKSKKACDCCSHHRATSAGEAEKMEETEEMRAMMVKTLMHTFPIICR